MSTARIHSRTVKRPAGSEAPTARIESEDESKQRKVAAIIEQRGKLNSIPDRLAGHYLFFRNWMYPMGKESHPNNPDLWYVDRYYPLAEGGPLAFDLPESDIEKETSEQKKPSLLAAGIRFFVIDRKKTVEDLMFEVGCGVTA